MAQTITVSRNPRPGGRARRPNAAAEAVCSVRGEDERSPFWDFSAAADADIERESDEHELWDATASDGLHDGDPYDA